MELKIKNFFLQDTFSPNRDDKSFLWNALNEFKKLKVSIPVAYNTIKTINNINKALEEYNAIRISIADELCEKTADGNKVIENNQYKFSEENLKEFNTKINDLLHTEVNIDVWSIKQSQIDNLKDIEINVYETLVIYNFIDMPEFYS